MMKSKMKKIHMLCFLIIGSLLLTGCIKLFDRPAPVTVQFYSIDEMPEFSIPNESKVNLPLMIRNFAAASSVEDRIAERISPNTLEYRHFERWSSPPQEIITRAFVSGLDSTGIFKNVFPEGQFPSRIRSYTLSGEVVRFEWNRTGNAETAFIQIRLFMTGADPESERWGGVIEAGEPVNNPGDSESFALSMERALRKALMDSATMIDGWLVTTN